MLCITILSVGGPKMGWTKLIQAWKSLMQHQSDELVFLSDYTEPARAKGKEIHECCIDQHNIDSSLANRLVTFFDENKKIIRGTFLFQPVFLSPYDSSGYAPDPISGLAHNSFDYGFTIRSLVRADRHEPRQVYYLLVRPVLLFNWGESEIEVYSSRWSDENGRPIAEPIWAAIDRIASSVEAQLVPTA